MVQSEKINQVLSRFRDGTMGAFMGRFGGSSILPNTVDIAELKAVELSIEILKYITDQSEDYGEDVLYGIQDRARNVLNDLLNHHKELKFK